MAPLPSRGWDLPLTCCSLDETARGGTARHDTRASRGWAGGVERERFGWDGVLHFVPAIPRRIGPPVRIGIESRRQGDPLDMCSRAFPQDLNLSFFLVRVVIYSLSVLGGLAEAAAQTDDDGGQGAREDDGGEGDADLLCAVQPRRVWGRGRRRIRRQRRRRGRVLVLADGREGGCGCVESGGEWVSGGWVRVEGEEREEEDEREEGSEGRAAGKHGGSAEGGRERGGAVETDGKVKAVRGGGAASSWLLYARVCRLHGTGHDNGTRYSRCGCGVVLVLVMQ